MKDAEQTLRQIFRTMDSQQAQRIREAYYKAAEGLHALAAELELADVATNDHALIHEHLTACRAMDAMKHSLLGRIL
jgi:hypothetical protein